MKTIVRSSIIILFVAVIIIAIVNIHSDAKRQSNWESNRSVITIYVERGDSLDLYWSRYAPSWMDRYDYRAAIMELNGMTNSMLYAGTTIQVYVEGGNN